MALPQHLVREWHLDQVSRLVHGTYVYFTLLIVLSLSTQYPFEHPFLFTFAATCFTLSSLLRILLITRREALYQSNPRFLHIGIWAAVILAAVPSGALYLSALIHYLLGTWPFTLIVVWTIGITSGSALALTPFIRLLALHLLITFLPALLVGLVRGGLKGFVFALGSAVMIVFLGGQGAAMHRAYLAQLQLRAREEERLRELEAARAQAEAANQFKTQFLANMSHEIRTPMHGILGLSQLALQEEMSPASRQYVEAIHSSGTSLLAILNEVLDLSKIEAGKLELTSAPFNLTNLIADSLLVVTPQAQAKNLQLQSSISPDLPTTFQGDPERLRQVLVNLLGNAVKFTSSGSVHLTVTRTGLNTEFRVTDTGIGIPADKQQAIFDVFTQADPGVTRKYGGSGLGLAISARIVELMGGQLQVESQPGQGSAFWFAIPLAPSAAPLPSCATPASATTTPAPLRILVAEDNLVSQRIVQALLEKQGHQVHIVHNGLAALHAWQSSEYDLLLLDHQMPEMSGTEAIVQIREQEAVSLRRRTPALILTASAMPGDRERFLASGLDGYLAKPFSADALQSAIDHLL